MTFDRIRPVTAASALAMMVCLVLPRAEAQATAQRVSAIREGKVRMTFAARPDICGYSDGISTGYRRDSNNRTSWSPGRSEDVVYDEDCSAGPLRVVVTMTGGNIARIRTYVGGRWRSVSGVTDLGSVSVKDATHFLLGIANTQQGKSAGEAIFPLTLTDSIDLVRALAPLAENESRSDEIRGQAIFWLGQTRSAVSAEYLRRLYGRVRSEEVKDKIIFALSQRREPAAVEKLMDIAKNDPDREARRKAMFWLGQSKDVRVAGFLTDIISR